MKQGSVIHSNFLKRALTRKVDVIFEGGSDDEEVKEEEEK
jgi:hypothetical protein